MAVTDIQRAFYGFQWLRSLSGGKSDHPPLEYGPAATGFTFTPNGGSACGIRVGDLVRRSSGLITLAAGNEAAANAAEPILGVCASIEYWDDSDKAMRKSDRLPSGGGVYGSVLQRQTMIGFIPVVGQVFAACLDEAHAVIDTQAELRALIDGYIDSRLDVSATDYVNPLLDASTASAVTAAQWRILGAEKTMSNLDISADNFRLEVTIHEAQRVVA